MKKIMPLILLFSIVQASSAAWMITNNTPHLLTFEEDIRDVYMANRGTFGQFNTIEPGNFIRLLENANRGPALFSETCATRHLYHNGDGSGVPSITHFSADGDCNKSTKNTIGSNQQGATKGAGGPENFAFMLSGDNKFASTGFYLRIQNTTGATVTNWNFSVDIYFGELGGGKSRIKTSYTVDNGTNPNTMSFTPFGSIIRSKRNDDPSSIGGQINASVTTPPVMDGAYIVLQIADKILGAGSSVYLDNIGVTAVAQTGGEDVAPSPPIISPSAAAVPSTTVAPRNDPAPPPAAPKKVAHSIAPTVPTPIATPPAPLIDRTIPAKEKLHVYVLFGQINMHGTGGRFFAEDLAEESRIMKYEPIRVSDAENRGNWDDSDFITYEGFYPYFKGTWVPFKSPACLDQWTVKKQQYYPDWTTVKTLTGVGPGRSFAREMLKTIPDPEVKIGIVGLAIPSGKIAHWVKNYSMHYPDRPVADSSLFYTNHLRVLQEIQQHATIKGILWHQGESDSDNTAYAEMLKRIITDFRTDLNLPNLPWVCGQIGINGNENKRVNKQLRSMISDRFPHFGVASPENLDLHDHISYTRDSQWIYGRRYAQKMLEIQKDPANTTQP